MARVCLWALMVWIVPALAWGERVELLFPPRPPYNFMREGKAVGPWVELAGAIFRDAGFTPLFLETPTKRILLELQKPSSRVCSFGWFKTAEREAFAVYSLPFFQDAPLVAVTRASIPAGISGKRSFDELTSTPELRLGLVAEWTYGAYVDKILKAKKTPVTTIASRQQQAAMLVFERFDYSLARESEFPELQAEAREAGGELAAIPLADLQERSKRYILCGKGFPAASMHRINASIQKLCRLND